MVTRVVTSAHSFTVSGLGASPRLGSRSAFILIVPQSFVLCTGPVFRCCHNYRRLWHNLQNHSGVRPSGGACHRFAQCLMKTDAGIHLGCGSKLFPHPQCQFQSVCGELVDPTHDSPPHLPLGIQIRTVHQDAVIVKPLDESLLQQRWG